MAMEIGIGWEYNGGSFVPNPACSPSRRDEMPNIRDLVRFSFVSWLCRGSFFRKELFV